MGGGGGGVSDNSSYMNGMGLARLVSVLCWWSDVGVEEAGLTSDVEECARIVKLGCLVAKMVMALVEVHVARVLRRL
jgi:hypothetical protein